MLPRAYRNGECMSRLPGGGGEQVDSQQVGPVARPDVDTPLQQEARGAFLFRCLVLDII